MDSPSIEINTVLVIFRFATAVKSLFGTLSLIGLDCTLFASRRSVNYFHATMIDSELDEI